MNIIFLGPPGSGKGTLAEAVKKEFDIPAISTGALLRETAAAQTDLGRQIKQIIDGGNLVPDTVMGDLIAERLKAQDCQKGYILDGFPRTLRQAQMLEQMGVKIDYVINLEMPDELIVQRLTGRLVCPRCGATITSRICLRQTAFTAMQTAPN